MPNLQDSPTVAWSATGGVLTGAAMESGTFIPVIGGSTGDPSVTYTLQDGFYRRIGDLVFVDIHLTTSALSGGSGTVEIRGLPFAVAQRCVLAMGYEQNITYPAGVVTLTATGVTGDTKLNILMTYSASTAGSNLPLTACGAASAFRIAGHYLATIP